MKKVEEKISKKINVTADEAWKVIGSVGGVDKWFGSLIKTCRVEDGKRFCETVDGLPLEEEILKIDHETRTFKFGLPTQELLPVSKLIEEMHVREDIDGMAIIDWSATFEATEENGKMAAEGLVQLWGQGLTEVEEFIRKSKNN